jgi:transposase InsO family protein
MNTETISSLFAQFVQNLLTKLLKKFKFIQSMSRKGNCYDNAVTESFFHTLNTEHVFWRKYKTRTEARQDILTISNRFIIEKGGTPN